MMAARQAEPGVRLSVLLKGLAEVPREQDISVSGIASDSRQVREGFLFLAGRGYSVHGLDFLDEALKRGAAAVVWEPGPETADPGTRIPVRIAVPDLVHKLGLIAARFHDDPSADLDLVAVTGTNGKSSSVSLLAQVFDACGRTCGQIGTLGYGMSGQLTEATHTTPDALRLQALFAEFRDAEARCVAMEASSHALAQERMLGTHVRVAMFTNLTRDHLDYHIDAESYGAAKARLFAFPDLQSAVINLDDAFGARLAANLPESLDVIGYTLGDVACPRARILRGEQLVLDTAGMHMRIAGDLGTGELRTPLLGRFNASNVLGVIGAAVAVGLDLAEVLDRLHSVHSVPGRMECFGGGALPLVIVDYAHTPDALEKVLDAARAHAEGELWCVFGCGGERDTGKRPMMGEIAARLAEHVVLTDDNPRGEDSLRIIADIRAGIPAGTDVTEEPDRTKALRAVLDRARPGDVVVLAGKGHETYQVIGRRHLPYDERETVAREIARLQEAAR